MMMMDIIVISKMIAATQLKNTVDTNVRERYLYIYTYIQGPINKMKKLTKETISLPDTNPYPIVLKEISQLRKSQQPPTDIKDVPLKLLPNEELKFAVSGKKSDGLINELTTSAGVPAHLLSKNNPIHSFLLKRPNSSRAERLIGATKSAWALTWQ